VNNEKNDVGGLQDGDLDSIHKRDRDQRYDMVPATARQQYADTTADKDKDCRNE